MNYLFFITNYIIILKIILKLPLNQNKNLQLINHLKRITMEKNIFTMFNEMVENKNHYDLVGN